MEGGMEMTEELPKLLQEHDEAHKATLEVLKETDVVLQHAQEVISEARIKLRNATEKYQERLNGPTSTRAN